MHIFYITLYSYYTVNIRQQRILQYLKVQSMTLFRSLDLKYRGRVDRLRFGRDERKKDVEQLFRLAIRVIFVGGEGGWDFPRHCFMTSPALVGH